MIAAVLILLALALAPPATAQTVAGDAQPVAPVNDRTRALDEEGHVGDYDQPHWTAHERFGDTAVYVLPKGMTALTYSARHIDPRHGAATLENRYEAGFGLPGRFQLNVHAVGHEDAGASVSAIDAQEIGLQWAFANWGTLWGNPTVAASWQDASGGSDVGELRLLLGGQLVSRWHWGSNIIWQQQAGGTRRTARTWTTGLSYAVKDRRAGLGIETAATLVDERATDGVAGRTPLSREIVVGPSLQLRPLAQLHIDVAPLFGVSADAPRRQLSLLLGWEF